MDRGASALPSAPVPDPSAGADVVPPHPLPAVLRVGVVGLVLIAGAVALGLVATAAGASVNSPIHPARVLLVFAGAVTVGAAVSMRPDLWQAWALGAAGAVLA